MFSNLSDLLIYIHIIIIILYFIFHNYCNIKMYKEVRIYNLEEIHDNKIIDNDRHR